MPLVIKSEDKTPHLALTHEAQGYSANNRHVSLLMKSDGIEYTPELLKAMTDLGLEITDDIQKEVFYNQKMRELQTLVNENYGDDKEYYSTWIVDFSDSLIIFNGKDGMFAVGYSGEEGNYSLDYTAKPVVTITSYQITDGKMEISEEAEDALEEGVLTLAKACLEKEKVQEMLFDLINKAATKKEGSENLSASAYAYVPDASKPSTWKLRIDDANHTRAAVAALGAGFRGNKVSIPSEDLPAVKRKVKAAYKKFFPDAEELPSILKSNEEVLALQEEIKKAVKEAEEILKAQLQEKEEALTKALAKVVEFETKEKEAVVKARKEKLSAVLPEGEVEDMFKSLEALADEAFDVVIKSLENKSKVEKESDLFKETGISGEGKPEEQAEAGLKLVGELINKAKQKQ